MTRDEFTSLPLAVFLGLFWDKNSGLREVMERTPKPQLPRPPKYDRRIYRKGGYQWASESALESLCYWHGKYAQSAGQGGEYAERDAKNAKELAFWIAWRRIEPNTVWSGKRNDEQVTADAPRDKPFVYEREPRNDTPVGSAAGRPAPTFDDDDSEEPPF